ncbi:MAG TPA: Asp-tRNA(Asn)/Glu-tRNA(Gln) amidotransferase subunit GatB [Firmicutes bacterium]|jgi:aspartyl-tRNA(Asn)/glutamyl-tRNA(Gln) amidotransferase subunit B|nr:Asp-tRNA(Asn)/Glu-tRNA(Gln) amidotransferase subunit GatB [Bacillota bacterium]
MNFEAVIGLEVHAELSTKTKIFCACSTKFGAEANTQTCPVCLGLPGTLPVLNEKVVEYCLRAGLALNCQITDWSKLDRKNYFYPDLPKAYQISQSDLPLCRDGSLSLASGKPIRITRIHIEEDAGKLIHSTEGEGYSLVDYNRAGVPLIEIVTAPDLATPEEAVEFLEKLRRILIYLGISDCKMEEGSLRCDANISLKPAGTKQLGTKTELKNINSFKALGRALAYEIERQSELLAEEKTVKQETRKWEEAKQRTLSMRSKEEAQDYRYFPDPDLVPIELDPDYVAEIAAALPELPEEKKHRFIEDYHLPEYDAELITGSKYLADFFEAVLKHYCNPKAASNFIMGELLRLMGEEGLDPEDLKVNPAHLGDLLQRIDEGEISITQGKKIFERVFRTGASPEEIIQAEGLRQISDQTQLLIVVNKVIQDYPQSVRDYLGGKEKAAGFLIGQIMRETKGQANPQVIKGLLIEELEKMRQE